MITYNKTIFIQSTYFDLHNYTIERTLKAVSILLTAFYSHVLLNIKDKKYALYEDKSPFPEHFSLFLCFINLQLLTFDRRIFHFFQHKRALVM